MALDLTHSGRANSVPLREDCNSYWGGARCPRLPVSVTHSLSARVRYGTRGVARLERWLSGLKPPVHILIFTIEASEARANVKTVQ